VKRLLVVDDEPDILLTMRLLLELAGYAIVEAATGQEALDRVQDMPDAVVLDIRLPDIDGLEVLSIIKADEHLARIPVVCVSAHSSGDTVRRAFALGAAAYVAKPFDFDDLLAVLAKAIDAGPCARSA